MLNHDCDSSAINPLDVSHNIDNDDGNKTIKLIFGISIELQILELTAPTKSDLQPEKVDSNAYKTLLSLNLKKFSGQL